MTASGASFGAAIFDMDGLLVDSEPLWHEAEIEVLGDLGVPLGIQACRQTKGMFVNEAIAHWYDRYPWDGPDIDTVADLVVERVCGLVVARGTLQPGVGSTIELCRRHGLAMAVASSCQYRVIELVLEHFDLARHFLFAHSAEDEAFGKPHPAVFLTAASKLGVEPTACLVFEDAPAGVLAAKAACMRVIAVPEASERRLPAFAIADAVLGSLEEVDEALFERLEASLHAEFDPTTGG
jgi:sugar-phosphatase